MKKLIVLSIIISIIFISCNGYNEIIKTTDYSYKYEAAKEYYATGEYTKAYQLLEELIMVLKATEWAEESLYMLGMCYYNLEDYETCVLYFDRYYKRYPKGLYSEVARFYSGKAYFLRSPDSRLDQSSTYEAIKQLQDFLDFYPYSDMREEANDMIYKLQDRLVKKEYDAAKLYYNLGTYTGNCFNGGSNYEACIITAENALNAYPYTNLREDLYILILRSRYQLAVNSVESRINERFRETIDEYYGFKNEFPDSKYTKEVDKIFNDSKSRINKIN